MNKTNIKTPTKSKDTLMRRLSIALLICLSYFSTPALAGPGHGHSHSHGAVSSEVAASKAHDKVQQLVKAGKIDASWAGRPAHSIEQKTYANGPEWVITFKNEQLSDTSKQTLYLFYSLDGHYIATNYTGQ